MKYLVIANISPDNMRGILFNIFTTKEEAIQWIFDNSIYEQDDILFDFFGEYESKKVIKNYKIDPITHHTSLASMRVLSKEEYIERYIFEFDDRPILIAEFGE